MRLRFFTAFVFSAPLRAAVLIWLACFNPGVFAQVSDGEGLTPLEGVVAISDDRALWDSVKDSRDVNELQAYLAQFPKGLFAAVAAIRIRALGGAGSVAVPQIAPTAQQKVAPGTIIKDCADCPEMVVIPAGSFEMGSSAAEQALANSAGLPASLTRRENPQHRVQIQSFAIGRYEVTQEQWYAVMGNNPGANKGRTLPAEQVSWDDTQLFIRRLNQRTGLAYRLPSEAEWEYAARAVSTSAWSSGNDESRLQDTAWYSANSDRQTHEVGQKLPNAFGLFDMHGNVWEWTQDCLNENYNGAPTDGSARTTGDCRYRVLRGGSFGGSPAGLRSAIRYWDAPGFRNGSGGLRLARALLLGSEELNLKAPDARLGEPEKPLSLPDTLRVLFEGREFAAELLEKRDFELAMVLIRKSDFVAAQKAFFNFLTRYPQSGYAPSGLFWLSTAQYQTRDYKEAILNFRQMISTAPDHLRAPEALLSVANCQAELKDTRGARKTLDDLIKAYPASEAASAAKGHREAQSAEQIEALRVARTKRIAILATLTPGTNVQAIIPSSGSDLKAPDARLVEPEKLLPVPDTVRVLFEGREFAAELLEKRDFELAMVLIRKSDFPTAQKAFFNFLTRYPQSGYAPSGLFWLANAQYQTRDYKEAILNFREMISTAPYHLRAPEALLSVANCQAELKDTRGARKTLDDLIKAYPASEAAGVAKDRLKLLK